MKSYTEIITILKKKGFIEDVPRRYFCVLFKDPFTVFVYTSGLVFSCGKGRQILNVHKP